jgi:hypothetical protein
MRSQEHMGAPLYRYTGQVGPRFGDSGSLVEWKWCHNVMFEANIHLRPLHTSILGMFKVLEPLVCCLKGIWVHPYTLTPAKPTPDLGTNGHLRSGNDVIMSWLRLMSTSDHFIHSYYAYTKCLSYWYAVSRACWCTLIPLHRPSCPRFGDSGSLEEWKWCHNVMFWADIYLRPLHT